MTTFDIGDCVSRGSHDHVNGGAVKKLTIQQIYSKLLISPGFQEGHHFRHLSDGLAFSGFQVGGHFGQLRDHLVWRLQSWVRLENAVVNCLHSIHT